MQRFRPDPERVAVNSRGQRPGMQGLSVRPGRGRTLESYITQNGSCPVKVRPFQGRAAFTSFPGALPPAIECVPFRDNPNYGY